MGNKAARVHSGDVQSPPQGGSPARGVLGNRKTIAPSGLSWGAVEDMIYKTVERKDWKGLQRLLQSHPEWVTSQSRDDEPPVLRALKVHAPAFVIETIISIEVMQVNRTDSAGNSTIHYATMHQASLATIQMVLTYDPNAKSRANNEGYLPLHLACKFGSSADVIDHLLKIYPAASETKTSPGQLPLHLAAEFKQPAAVIDKLIKAFPRAVNAVYQGDLPIHIACRARASGAILKALLDANPSTSSIPGRDEMLPIHCAVANKCPVDAAIELVQRDGDSLLIRDKSYRMALHHALERNCLDDVVLTIVKNCPEAARHRGRGTPGEFPLAIAVEQGFSEHVLLPLMRAYPDALKVKTVQNMYILRNALRHKLSTVSIAALLEEFPAAASELDDHGRVALHYAVSRLYPVQLIDALLRAYPPGISTFDHNLQSPLHLLALRAVAHIDRQDPGIYANYLAILSLLLNRFPTAVDAIDKYGLSPINYLIENNSPLEIFELFLQGDRGAGRGLVRGKIPLHHAIHCQRSVDLLRLLLHKNPSAASIPCDEKDGQCALHLAILRPLPLESLVVLEEAFPAVCLVKDRRQRLPIHYALEMKTDVEIVRRLLVGNSEVVHEIVDDSLLPLALQAAAESSEAPARSRPATAHTPLTHDCCQQKRLFHLAIGHQCSAAVVAEVLRYTMPFTPHTSSLNLLHYHFWTHLLAHTNDEYPQAVDLLLDLYSQDVIYQLSQFPDQHTQKALDIASPKSRDVLVHRLHYFKRYELAPLICHRTDCSVHNRAIDHFEGRKMNVVLKFLSRASRNAFQAESKARAALARYRGKEVGHGDEEEDSKYILPAISLVNGEEDYNYRQEAQLKGFGDFPNLVVTMAAKRSLGGIIREENISNRSEDRIRFYGRLLCEAIRYLHQSEVVHTNLNGQFVASSC